MDKLTEALKVIKGVEANRERQRQLKARRTAAGFHQLTEWVHDDDRQALKEFARCLRSKRFEGGAE
ncbi:MAG: hypothetical protein H7835_18885 [Magnetococcus sp. XQGC-1]